MRAGPANKGYSPMLRYLCAALIGLCCTVPAAAGNWPAWRGPDGQGHCTEKDVPLTWDAKTNVRWCIDLPDSGNSTPVVWGDRVFVTQAKDKTIWPPKGGNGGEASAETRMLLCFRRGDGKLLWDARVTYKEPEWTHPTNPFCSGSPVTDGERVIVSHGSAGLFCYDFDGNALWKKDVGKMEHLWGNASSPILHGDLCILWVGPGEKQTLLALNKKTGQEVWRHEEMGGKDGIKNKDWLGSWCTPIIAQVGDHEELILSAPEKVKGFDPKTGKELWVCNGLGKLVYTSPLCSKDGIVVAMAGYGGQALAVRAGGSGDVTATHRLWQHKPGNPQRIGSAVIVGDYAYILNDPGTAQCLDLKTGEDRWKKERLGGGTWGSMVAVGDRLYILKADGETLVLTAGPKPEILARNKIGEPTKSSLAISDGDVFIRTYKHLWCISRAGTGRP